MTAGKGGDTLLPFRTFRHLFATSNLKLLIFLNRIASNYQTAAQLHKRCYFLSTQTLLTLFQIFLLISLPDRITEETCPLSGIKVNHEIIWSWNKKTLISRPRYLMNQCRIIFCDNFCDMFPFEIICDRKWWPKFISN